MNVPKETKRFCPYCKKRTDQNIGLVSTGFKRGELKTRKSISRSKSRGAFPGMGNKGKTSQERLLSLGRGRQKQQQEKF